MGIEKRSVDYGRPKPSAVKFLGGPSAREEKVPTEGEEVGRLQLWLTWASKDLVKSLGVVLSNLLEIPQELSTLKHFFKLVSITQTGIFS